MVYAACRTVPHGDAYALAGVDVGREGKRSFFGTPASFWAAARKARKGPGAVLLVLGDPHRDLALLGLPDGAEWKARVKQQPLPPDHWQWGYGPPPPCECAGMVASSYSARFEGSPAFIGRIRHGYRSYDVRGLGNWHPDTHAAHLVPFEEAYPWVLGYRQYLDRHDLGPTMMPTVGAQAMRSFRRHAAGRRDSGEAKQWPLGEHDDAPLHAMELAAFERQGPKRHHPGDAGPFDAVHYLDFTAHYVSIMATERLPSEPNFVTEGRDHRYLDYLHDNPTCLFMAEVVTHDGERKMMLGPEWPDARDAVAEIGPIATYRHNDHLASWARRMFTVRNVDREWAPMSKRIGVSLWGYLCRKTYKTTEVRDAGHDYSGVDTDLHGVGRMWLPDNRTALEIDGDGRQCITEIRGQNRGRHLALGAFMLYYGRRKLDELIARVGEENLLESHTDSMWTTVPVPGVGELSRPLLGQENWLGGITQEVVRDVEWRNGYRYVAGVQDTYAGQRLFGRRWVSLDAQTTPGVARMEAV